MTNVRTDIFESRVRNYEVDYQGIVNNANYFHYLDYARTILLKKIGLDVNKLAVNGINIILIETQIYYKKPLKADEYFCVKSALSRISKFKYAVEQNIFFEDKQICTQSKSIIATITATGKPIVLKELDSI